MSASILTGDCRKIVRTLPSSSVDLVVADPPYGETNLAWDTWPEGWVAVLPRVMKPHASLWVFGSQRMFIERGAEFLAAGFRVAQDLVWEKHNGSNSSSDRFRRVHEHAVQFYLAERQWSEIFKNPIYTNDATARTVRRKKRPVQWGALGNASYVSQDGGPRLMRSVMFARSVHGRAVHPTQKPVACVLPMIEYSSPVGAVVLDPFGGSGTTAIGCKQLGRECILIEVDPVYVALAQRRLVNDAPLFGGVAA